MKVSFVTDIVVTHLSELTQTGGGQQNLLQYRLVGEWSMEKVLGLYGFNSNA